MRYTMLMILSILLTACNSEPAPTPRAATHYTTVKDDIPAELLRCVPAPDAAMIKRVRFRSGEAAAKRYTKALILANYKNCQKIRAIRKIVQ